MSHAQKAAIVTGGSRGIGRAIAAALLESGASADWKLAPEDVARVVVDLIAHPGRSLPSHVDIRPSMPPKKK